MEFKGTQGNWIFKESEITEDCFTVWGFCERIAELNYHTSLSNKKLSENLKKKAEANAKLISKAPELLEKLKELVEVINWYQEKCTPIERNRTNDEHFYNVGVNARMTAENLILESTTI